MAKKTKNKTAKPLRPNPPTKAPYFALHSLVPNWLLASPSKSTDEPTWRYLWWLLALAFILRAFVSISGDFVIHPDEIMQYLEPAHGLIFGNNISYWEYFYGARSWVVPGFVAALMQLSVWLGLDSANHYINVVKLGFCALSLFIPYGMYIAGRHLLGELSGRLALLLGTFWYELLGFAHKPMTEFVATSLLFALIAIVFRPSRPTHTRATMATLIAVLIVAVRFHYAPLAGLILLTEFVRATNRTRIAMTLAGIGSVLAVGLLDYFTWGGFLHSYWINLKVNLLANTQRGGESTALHFPAWLSLASGGAFLAALAAVGTYFKRRRYIFILIAVIVLPHMMQEHREYRFIFAAIPLWLLLFADLLAVGWQKSKKDTLIQGRPITGITYAVIISLIGIFNAIPFQKFVYKAYSQESGYVNFIVGQDPIFTAYRYLANSDNIQGVWDVQNTYFNTTGYYYLHHKVPFYDNVTGYASFSPNETAQHVSHIIVSAPVEPRGVSEVDNGKLAIGTDRGYLPLPRIINDKTIGKLVYWDSRGESSVLDDFVADTNFGNLYIWKLTDTTKPIRQWQKYDISPDSKIMDNFIKRAVGKRLRQPAENYGIEFAEQ